MSQLKVYINNGKEGRRLVNVDIVEERKRTLLVRLPDGKVITRKKVRDLPPQKES